MRLFRLIYSPEAQRDLANIAACYSSPGIASAITSRFLHYAKHTAERLRSCPHAGRLYTLPHELLHTLHVLPVNIFSDYPIFYIADGTTVEIVRVLHGARDVRALLESTL
ncbi:type II toxin-antitoxin system RelE/ParE family toxin [Terriglobus tenax]|uniref:type II toxin-antitoxin system RelE/ParE family toxin n=1 Tax=Terriglobus tenax TaxID=1111115 RepID=UPI0021E0D226|nr:type II toxin-antitoxin system RelE/ParE family toxin [Terriglobus tenax]